ncbi:unnamed protein product [Protopolystoma xenopodis]|uniref:Uncharacterized protein n=1 Tax=Protopolystoma xenopodis TaxID=117903 RepID=A0A448X8Y7_9PLAT|nr:unnamed protein product [Protopolystoma xenopodis]
MQPSRVADHLISLGSKLQAGVFWLVARPKHLTVWADVVLGRSSSRTDVKSPPIHPLKELGNYRLVDSVLATFPLPRLSVSLYTCMHVCICASLFHSLSGCRCLHISLTFTTCIRTNVVCDGKPRVDFVLPLSDRIENISMRILIWTKPPILLRMVVNVVNAVLGPDVFV